MSHELLHCYCIVGGCSCIWGSQMLDVSIAKPLSNAIQHSVMSDVNLVDILAFAEQTACSLQHFGL